MNQLSIKSCLLSIVIPVYNRQKSLDLLLSELLNSKGFNGFKSLIEVIVVDDGSTNPVEIIENTLGVDCFFLEINSGAPKARKYGYEKSQGRFVHFHDSDDSIARDWLSNVINELKSTPDLDILVTARYDQNLDDRAYKCQSYFHKQVNHPEKVKSRLVYRNCMGPLGGVTFSRKVLEKINFKAFSSCQDWQMYLDAINYSKVLSSLPDTHFIFNKAGSDRISHNPRKKILGHLQLAKITAQQSIFKKNIRLFYLYTCKQHIANKGGLILTFYKKNRLQIFITFIIVSVYWRLS